MDFLGQKHPWLLYLIQIFEWNILKEEGMVQVLSVNIYTAKVGKGYICVMLSTEQRSFTQSIYSSFSSFRSWPKLQCLNPVWMVIRYLLLYKQTKIKLIQVNLFQKHLILHQLTHNMWQKIVHWITSSVHEYYKLSTYILCTYINCSEW